jgi:hypothetical protein
MNKFLLFIISLPIFFMAIIGAYTFFYQSVNWKALKNIPQYPRSKPYKLLINNKKIEGIGQILLEIETTDSDSQISSFYINSLKKDGWKELTINNAISNLTVLKYQSGMYINDFMLTKKIDDVLYVFGGIKRDIKKNSKIQLFISYKMREYSL